MEKIEWQFLGKKFIVKQENIEMLNAYERAYQWYVQLGNRQDAIKAADKISAILRNNGYPKGVN